MGLLGILRLRGPAGRGVSAWLQARLPRPGAWGGFLLGVAFSSTFCPTLLWLFFGLTIPLALRSAGRIALPGLFAVGTAPPLVVLTGILTVGSGAAGAFTDRPRRSHGVVSRIAGAVFTLAGAHNTLTCWAP